MHAGALSEVGITKYSFYLVDEDGVRIYDLPAISNISSDNKANGSSCCDIKAYKSVRIKAVMPENYTRVRLEVVPVYELDGWSHAMEAGLMTGVIKDWYDPAFVRLTSKAGRQPDPL